MTDVEMMNTYDFETGLLNYRKPHSKRHVPLSLTRRGVDSAFTRGRVLVIDSVVGDGESSECATLRLAMETCGFKTQWAQGFKAAVESLDRETFDFVVLDPRQMAHVGDCAVGALQTVMEDLRVPIDCRFVIWSESDKDRMLFGGNESVVGFWKRGARLDAMMEWVYETLIEVQRETFRARLSSKAKGPETRTYGRLATLPASSDSRSEITEL